MSKARPIAFLDRDGTLVREPDDEQVDRLDKIELVPGVIPALLRLKQAGYEFVMVSNQDGLGTDSFPQADFDTTQGFIADLFASQGIVFRDVFICPHTPKDNCRCRKPLPGLLGSFLVDNDIDRVRSIVIGDRQTDLEFADNIGLRGWQIAEEPGRDWSAIAHELVDRPRRATVARKTKETDIRILVDLDAEGPTTVATGIGFFDHMLEQIAKHGGFALTVECAGDLDVDEHHTVEDVSLALGQALRDALGDKRGIGRYGFTLPMDEAQAQVALDLSGRAYFVWDGDFARNEVGGLPTELVPHFFRSLAESLGAALHVAVRGENTHHMVEACFKATGRALRQATARVGSELPTTKGAL